VIFPELGLTRVQTSNPGFGLYTTFKIRMQILTEVRPMGTITAVAPDDFYFGDELKTQETAYNPLTSVPPPQGAVEIRTPADQWHSCEVLRTWLTICPFEFEQCRIYDEFYGLLKLGVNLPQPQRTTMLYNKGQCDKLRLKCSAPPSTSTTTTLLSQAGTHRLSDLVQCRSRGTELELALGPNVILASMQVFEFAVKGYNARTQHVQAALDDTWYFVTKAADGEQTVLDEKSGIDGVFLMGIVDVPSIMPADTKVGSIENYVTITLKLTTTCQPRAKLKIEYPMEYRRNANAAFTGSAIETGDNFPRQVEKISTLNVIELIAIEEALPADTEFQITIGLSNPQISPDREDNIWKIEASTLINGPEEVLNVNYFVEGFKIFGEFAKTKITGTVLSPTANNIICPWFILKSKLDYTPGVRSEMKIWMPKGFIPVLGPAGDCGAETHRRRRGGGEWSITYDKEREGVKYPHPPEIQYFGLPSGSDCFPGQDEDNNHFVKIKIDGLVDYGLDYAFEFLVTNPRYPPPPDKNFWRFETLRNNVILHLEQDIPGFDLEQIKMVKVFPSDTTTLISLNEIEFFMQSDKYIPGGSTIKIRGPYGFLFTCRFFRTDAGLASTTTCFRRLNEPNIVIFTIDSQDPKAPESPFRLFVRVANPEFTPQQNYWGFDIVSPLGKFIDIRDNVSSFDITGTVRVEILPSSPYLGEDNRLQIEFEQSTILNQADNGNEVVVTAPIGYTFPTNCTGFFMRLSNPKDVEPEDDDGYPATYSFPPPGIKCMGFDNRTVVIRLPNGKGLLRSKYMLEVDVQNPGYQPNTSNAWEFITRVRNPETGQRIVDANRTLGGFLLVELVPLRKDEDAAHSRFSMVARLLSMFLPFLSLSIAVSPAHSWTATDQQPRMHALSGSGHSPMRLNWPSWNAGSRLRAD
jgi:hypothetical protein